MFKLELKCWFDEAIIWKVSTKRTRFSQGAEEGQKRGKIFKYKTFLHVQNSPVELLITLYKSLDYFEKKHKHISIWLIQWSW